MFCLLIIKQIDSMLRGACTIKDHKRHQNVFRKSMTHFAAPLLLLFRSYHILMSSMIYYCSKDSHQHWICLLIGSLLKSPEIPPTFNFEFVIITWFIIFQIKVHKSYFNAPLISNLNLPVTVSVGGIVLGPIWRAYHTRCCSEGLCWETSLFFRKKRKNATNQTQ